MIRLLLACAAALLFASAAPAAPARDWSVVATRTADGTFVQGNPKARVKLVEYLSFTCPHCAHFEGEGIAPLTANYIRTGLVSYEVRQAVRDGFDLTAALLARCAGPERFFPAARAVFAAQQTWITQAGNWSPPAEDTPPEKLLPMMAKGAGLDAMFRARGLPQARIDACLSGAADRDVLTKQAKAAWAIPGFPGTPTFYLNGRMLGGVGGWADLETKIKAALKS